MSKQRAQRSSFADQFQTLTHQERVSVIIPCFNQAHFLPEAIESALGQSKLPAEIIVVDDGSTDGTSEVANRYAGVRCIRRPNGGLSAARNTGLEVSTGDCLVFLDADDRLLPNAIQDGLTCLQAHPEAAFVYGHFRYLRGDGSLLHEAKRAAITDDYYAAFLERNFIAMHATVIYRRAVFDWVGHFDPSLRACEDYDLYLRISRLYPIAGHDEVVAEYRQHNESMSHNAARMLKASIDVLARQRPYVRADPKLSAAYAVGMRFWQNYYGGKLVRDLIVRARQGSDWWGLQRDLRVLLRYDRPGVVKLGRRLAGKGRRKVLGWR